MRGQCPASRLAATWPVHLSLALLVLVAAATPVAAAAADETGVVFTKDVAPIFMNNCVTCHRPGEIARANKPVLDEERAQTNARANLRAQTPEVVEREIVPVQHIHTQTIVRRGRRGEDNLPIGEEDLFLDVARVEHEPAGVARRTHRKQELRHIQVICRRADLPFERNCLRP